MAVFYSDNSWYRALIQEMTSEECVKVRFLDYGNSQLTKLKDILSLPPEFCQLPFQSLLCSIKHDPKFIVSEIRQKKFNELIHPDLICNFKCTIKQIEGQIHYVQINYLPSDTAVSKDNIDVNEEVEMSDIPFDNFPYRANPNWADESPSPVTAAPLTSFHKDTLNDNQKNYNLQNRHTDEDNSYTGSNRAHSSSTNHTSTPESSQRNTSNSLQLNAAPFYPRNNEQHYNQVRRNYQNDQNWRSDPNQRDQKRRSNYSDTMRGPSNDRANPRGPGQYQRDKYSTSSNNRQPATYDCIPSLFVKCDIFSGAGNEMISKIFEKHLSNEHFNLIQQVHLDKKSIGSHVFVETKTHEEAEELLQALQGDISFDSNPVVASFARRYQEFRSNYNY